MIPIAMIGFGFNHLRPDRWSILVFKGQLVCGFGVVWTNSSLIFIAFIYVLKLRNFLQLYAL